MNHYVYLIIDQQPHSSKRFYIGKRSCNCLIENDYKYMSSSTDKEFKQFIKDNFNRFKKIILNVFETNEEALQNEIFLHDLFDVGRSHYFYNKAKSTSTGWSTFGIEKSEAQKQKLSLAHLGKKLTNEHKMKISESGKLAQNKPEVRERNSKIQKIVQNKLEVKLKKSLNGKGKKRSNLQKQNYRFSKLGEKNPNAKIINIFDDKNNLILTIIGGFKRICKEQNYPTSLLIYTYKNNTIIASKKYKQFNGWYARII